MKTGEIMEPKILEKAKYWAESSVFDVETRKEVQTLLDNNDEKELNERFCQNLEFGTGGLRGIIGVGINRMNRYTVRQATEGLARYIQKCSSSDSKSGVVIGYDPRHKSVDFAKASAEVLAGHGIPVYVFSDIAPTPLTSYVVLQKNAIAGIMITASHNPPEWNGYKVYWDNGGQIIPPHDIGIINEVKGVTNLEDVKYLEFDKAVEQGLVKWIGEEEDSPYLEEMKKITIGNPEHNKNLGVIYTPLHGTGKRLVPKLLKQSGFDNLLEVPVQSDPDSDFSTVRSPNPEDEKAMERAISVSRDTDDLILANDPDADRLGVMIKHNGKWERLNGNQIGALLLDYHLADLKEKGELPENSAFIGSIVSTPMCIKIARAYGVKVYETLTGFKWIYDMAWRMEKGGWGKFIFGMEESHGYLAGTYTGDKDGVWAAMAFADMIADLKAQGKTAIDKLNELYETYGNHLDALKNQTLPGLEGVTKIRNLMENFRKNPPKTIGGKKVLFVTDLQEKKRIELETSEISPSPELPVSNVLIFELEGNGRVIMRPSGTEPKIKYYVNLSQATKAEMEDDLNKILDDVCSKV